MTLCAWGVGFEQVEFICKTLNCLPIAHIDHMRPEKLGHADLVEEVSSGKLHTTTCSRDNSLPRITQGHGAASEQGSDSHLSRRLLRWGRKQLTKNFDSELARGAHVYTGTACGITQPITLPAASPA